MFVLFCVSKQVTVLGLCSLTCQAEWEGRTEFVAPWLPLGAWSVWHPALGHSSSTDIPQNNFLPARGPHHLATGGTSQAETCYSRVNELYHCFGGFGYKTSGFPLFCRNNLIVQWNLRFSLKKRMCEFIKFIYFTKKNFRKKNRPGHLDSMPFHISLYNLLSLNKPTFLF